MLATPRWMFIISISLRIFCFSTRSCSRCFLHVMPTVHIWIFRQWFYTRGSNSSFFLTLAVSTTSVPSHFVLMDKKRATRRRSKESNSIFPSLSPPRFEKVTEELLHLRFVPTRRPSSSLQPCLD